MKKLFALLLVILVMCSAAPALAAPESSSSSGGYEVKAIVEPENGGSVEGAGSYSKGKSAVLTATPADGFIFVGWYREGKDAAVSTDPKLTYDLEETRTYIARFAQKYTVGLAVSPEEGGSVSQSGSGEYMLDDSVTVTATPAENYSFVGWYTDPAAKDPISTDASYTFQMTDSLTLTAKFSATYTLDLIVTPEGTGSVVGAGQYSGGSVVTIGASPAKDYRFTGWYDSRAPGKIISTDPEYNLNLDENRTLGAQFDRSYGYILMWVAIWIGIGFAVFVIVMRTIRRIRMVRRRRRRRPRRRF